MTKDELRVLRQIDRLERQLIATLDSLQPSRLRREREFEKYCTDNHLIYSPF